MSAKANLKIDWCTHEAAKYAVENWHYSRTLPAQKTVRVGAWEDGKFIGCVIFAWGANRNMPASLGLVQTECAELVRVALAQHITPVSRIVAIAIRMLRKQSPGLRALFSYADPNHGHHGGIYQAGGWLYTGKSQPNEAYIVNGTVMHKRAFTGLNYGKAAKQLPANAVKVMPIPKFRYVLPLDQETRARLEPLAKPYPKRGVDTQARSAVDNPRAGNGSPVSPPDGEGGAKPTPALQDSKGGA